MSDINSGLPVRTQLPGQANYDDVVVRVADGTTSSQLLGIDSAGRVTVNQGAPNTEPNAWPVLITDGTNTISLTPAGEVKVSVTEPLPVGTNVIGAVTQSGGPWTANLTEVGGAALALGQTTMAASIPVTIASNQTPLPVTQSTSPWVVSGTVALSEDTNYGTVGANTIRTASQIGNATGAADFNNGATGAQTLRVAANLAVGGANVSASNPVPVALSAAPLGTPVNNYNTVAAIAAGASSNHIYTITAAKTFQGKKIWASASGLMKIEVRVSPDGSTYSTLWVGFNSTATPNITIDMDELVFLESGSGSTVEIIRTNMDKKPMDVYSTISGTEV